MQDFPWTGAIAIIVSLVALGFSVSAELRARRAEVKFEVELDEKNLGRIIVRNTGSKTVRGVHIERDALAGVRYTASHNEAKTLIPGDKIEIWADAPDHDNIPNTLRVRFGRSGVRALKVPGDGRPFG